MSDPRLIQHLEHYLGELTRGFQLEQRAGQPRTQIALFEHGPFANTDCYCTLGLSHHRLHQKPGSIRMELLMMLRRGEQSRSVAGILATVVDEMLARHEALPRGAVIGPRGPLWEASRLEALYVASPAYLPDTFGRVELESGERCIVAWLVPISAAEAAFVSLRGWPAFEELLVAEDPDLLAPDREELRAVDDC